MNKTIKLMLLIVGCMSFGLQAGFRRHAPKRHVTVRAQVSVRTPVKRVVVKRVRPVRIVRPVRVAPVRRVCCQPSVSFGFGFGIQRPGCGVSFGFGL